MRFTSERIRQEIVSPSRKTSRLVLDFIHGCFDIFLKRNKFGTQKCALVWDIRSNPITFDICYLVLATSNYFQKYGDNSFDVILYMPKDYTPKPFTYGNYHKSVTSEDIVERIDNLVIPLFQSFNCVENLLIVRDRDDLLELMRNRNIFPVNYKPRIYYPNPYDHPKTSPSINRLSKSLIPHLKIDENKLPEILEDFDKDYATFTLRDYGFSPERNTTNDDLKAFCAMADALNLIPIIVPDEKRNLNKYDLPSNIHISYDSRKNLYKRIVLYSKSNVNVFAPSGPFYSSLFIRGTKSIVYNMDCFDDEKPGDYGYYRGDQPYLNLSGYLLWRGSYEKLTYKELLSSYEILSN
mgnify:FL=1